MRTGQLFGNMELHLTFMRAIVPNRAKLGAALEILQFFSVCRVDVVVCNDMPSDCTSAVQGLSARVCWPIGS